MRTHAEIISEAGGWRELRRQLGMATDDSRPKFWFFRDSIPSEYWVPLVELSLTTLEELALASYRRALARDRAA